MNFDSLKGLILDSTKIKAYSSCPRKYFYEYELGWKSTAPSNHLVFGSSVHLAIEYLFLNGYGQKRILEAYELFLADYRKTFGPETDEAFEPKTPDNFLALLTLYAKKYARDLEEYDVLHTEISGVVSLESIDTYFRMDAILRNRETGKIVGFENKTGSAGYLWDEQWDLSTQIGMYSHALYSYYGADAVEALVINGLLTKKSKKGWAELKAMKTLTVAEPYDFRRVFLRRNENQMNIWLVNTLMLLTNMATDYESLNMIPKDEGFIMTAFPMREANCQSYNRMCEYHAFCNSWVNPVARAYEPPPGFEVRHWDPREKPAKTLMEVKNDSKGITEANNFSS